MAKAPALNLAALNIRTVDTDKRSVTSEAVQRPTRDIMAQINESVRRAAWAAALETIAAMHGKPVEAKGANWDVNADEAARAIRVNYNQLQPDYFPTKKTSKMDKAASRDVWVQIAEQLGLDEPVFSDDSNDADND